MTNILKKQKNIDVYGWIVLTVFFVVFNYFLMKNMDMLLDSDMSSELILAQIMSKEKTLLTDRWYYSTELRVFNTQYIFAPLFLLINNYHIVRRLGTVLLELSLLASFYYMCKKLDVKHIWLYSFFIVGCYSLDYFNFFIRAPHYIPYLFAIFLEIGLLINIKNSKNRISKIISIVLFFVLALLSSLNGVRQLESFFLPLLISLILLIMLSAIFKYDTVDKELVLLIVIGFAVSVICYLVSSKVFAIKYELSSSLFNYNIVFPSVSKILDTIYGLFVCFGYNVYTGNIYRAVSFVMAFIAIIVSVIASFSILINKKEFSIYDRLLTLVFIVSSGITVSLFLFTTMPITFRYLQLNTVLAFPIIGVYFSKKSRYSIFKAILCLMIVFCVVNSFASLNYNSSISTNEEFFEMKEIIEKNNINEGIASFWNASVINEISDGKIDVWHYCVRYDMTIDDLVKLNTGKWLQDKKHFDCFPIGKMFFIIDSDTIVIDRNKIKEYLVYDGDIRQMYIFDSYDEFKTILLG